MKKPLLLLLTVFSFAFSKTQAQSGNWSGYTEYKGSGPDSYSKDFMLEYATKIEPHSNTLKIKWKFTNYLDVAVYDIKIAPRVYVSNTGETWKQNKAIMLGRYRPNGGFRTSIDINWNGNFQVRAIQVMSPEVTLRLEPDGPEISWYEYHDALTKIREQEAEKLRREQEKEALARQEQREREEAAREAQALKQRQLQEALTQQRQREQEEATRQTLKAEEQVEPHSETTKHSSNTPQANQGHLDAPPQNPVQGLTAHQEDPLLYTEEVTPMPSYMAFVKGGTYQMGGTDWYTNEKPIHTVTVSDFYIGRHEVTFEEYDAYCEATGKSKPHDNGWGRERRPVINVSWEDAVAYCNWRSKQERYQPVYTIRDDGVTANWRANGYRLPTEAEWEFAARERGKNVRFGNGKNIARSSELNFNASENRKEPYSEIGEYRKQTVPVGSLNSPNQLRLHDMSGNVWEWCWDWYDDEYYGKSPDHNPRGPRTGADRVIRGGSWFNRPIYQRCSFRVNGRTDGSSNGVGFRLARSSR